MNGLVGSRLSLQNNGVTLTGIGYAAIGAYPAFDYYLPGTAYNITVGTQPTNPSQTCVVANGMGTLGNSNVTNIMVTCTTHPARFVYVRVSKIRTRSYAKCNSLTAMPRRSSPVHSRPGRGLLK